MIIERWFRNIKTEEIYIFIYGSPREPRLGIKEYIRAYNFERPHSSLADERPAGFYSAKFSSQKSFRIA